MSEITPERLDALIDAIEREANRRAMGDRIVVLPSDDVLALVAALRAAWAKNERAVETLRAFGLLADETEPDYDAASADAQEPGGG